MYSTAKKYLTFEATFESEYPDLFELYCSVGINEFIDLVGWEVKHPYNKSLDDLYEYIKKNEHMISLWLL